MSTTKEQVRLVAVEKEEPQPAECAKCREQKAQLAALRKEVRELKAANERYLRAIQRESHHMDTRAPHDGKNYIKRNK